MVNGPPNACGILLGVQNMDAPVSAFVALQRVMHEVGLLCEAITDESLQPNSLNFVVAQKPE